MDGTGAGKGPTPATAVTFDTPSARVKPSDVQRASAPTIFEPAPLVESKLSSPSNELNGELGVARNPIGASSGNLSNSASVHSGNLSSSIDGQRSSVEPQIATASGAANQGRRVKPSETVVTPLPPFGRFPDDIRDRTTFKDIWSRNRQAILQSAAFILLAALLVAIVAWWISISRQKGIEGLASTQPTLAVTKQQAGQQAPSTTQTNLAAVPVPEGMVYVPGGKFEMGRSNGDEYERPAHTVTVGPFFIDRTEVTNEQYQRFVTETGHRAPTHWPNDKFTPTEAKLPVVNVSWDDANAYAVWAGKRLPTEAEWEFAARGTDGRLYPWGNAWIATASNAGHVSNGRIVEAGRFPAGASPFGALDMCGNVWEWTASNPQSYAEGQQEIAPGKVIRGGAFDVPSDRATATYRGVLPADRLRDKTGFRTVRDAK
ncbi:MAG: SUMF1/EgtB/PvdO family nonheme iron enzyme [Acidobacteriota bacterium]